MGTAGIILRQIVVMFIYMAIGWLLFKKKLVTKEGSGSLANVLLSAVMPCVILNSFSGVSSPEKNRTVLLSILGAALALALSMVLAHLVYRKDPVADFGSAFSNAGFMGIPLVAAAFGSQSVIYVSGMMAFLLVLQWTYGQSLLAGNWNELALKKIAANPLVIAFVIGMAVYFGRMPLPGIIKDCLSSMAALNAPLAMIILGTYLAEVSFREIFTSRRLWAVSLYRGFAIPLATMALLLLVFPRNRDMASMLLISASAPVGANVAVFAKKQGKDYQYACKLVCLSTLLSAVTMPAVMLLWNTVAV